MEFKILVIRSRFLARISVKHTRIARIASVCAETSSSGKRRGKSVDAVLAAIQIDYMTDFRPSKGPF